MTSLVSARGRASGRRSLADRFQRLTWTDGFWAFVFLFPTLIGLSLVLGSVLGSLAISLTKWDILRSPEWVGLSNYVKAFTDDERFARAILNTAYYTFGVVPTGTVLSLFAAILMNQKLKGQSFFRTVYFLPTVCSGTAIALLWGWLYNSQYGLLNHFRVQIGLPKISWLGDKRFAMPAVIIMSIWRGLGYNMVLFLAGLQGIPDVYYEASKLDGAGRWRTFRHIVLPLLSPTTFFVVLMSIIGSFQVFEATYIMTGGGPYFSTETMVLLIFYQGFQWFRMGYASALAYILFAIIMFFTGIQMRLERLFVHYEA